MGIEVKEIMAVVVGILVASIMLPMALIQWFSANTTGLPDTVTSMWGIVGVLVLLGIIIALVPRT